VAPFSRFGQKCTTTSETPFAEKLPTELFDIFRIFPLNLSCKSKIGRSKVIPATGRGGLWGCEM
jgi:hypothetical protein